MLVELRIRDYAVVEDLTLTLGPGLNALTGETGAGKSIIVGALSLLLGERASSGVIFPCRFTRHCADTSVGTSHSTAPVRRPS